MTEITYTSLFTSHLILVDFMFGCFGKQEILFCDFNTVRVVDPLKLDVMGSCPSGNSARWYVSFLTEILNWYGKFWRPTYSWSWSGRLTFICLLVSDDFRQKTDHRIIVYTVCNKIGSRVTSYCIYLVKRKIIVIWNCSLRCLKY